MGLISIHLSDEFDRIIDEMSSNRCKEKEEVIKKLIEKGLEYEQEAEKISELKRSLSEIVSLEEKRLDGINEKFEELDKNVTMITKYFWDLYRAVEDLERRL